MIQALPLPGLFMLLPLAQIRRENDLQARDQSHWTRDGAERTALDPAHVAVLVEVLRSGRTFSTRPIVYQDGDTYWLADGWHRLAAYEVVGSTEIEVEIREGGRRGAFRHALGANAEHGKPRTQKDKRRAVDLALGDAELGKLSNREIGDITGTSHTFVAGRRELRAAGEAMRQAAPRSRALGLAKARAALVCALNGAKSVGVETFDLPGRPGQEVALWYDGIDELSREEIDEAIQALGDAHRAKTVPLYRQPPPRPDPLPGQQLLTGGEVPAVAPASERRAESRALGARIGRCIAALRLMDPHDLVHLGGDVGLVEAGILLGSATSAPWAEIELATLEAALFPAITPNRDDGPGSLVALESTCPDPFLPAASPASPSAEKVPEAPPATADDCADSATAGAGLTCSAPSPSTPTSSAGSSIHFPQPEALSTGTISLALTATTERPESWQAAITAALGLPAEEPLALVLRSLALLQSQRDRYGAALTEYATAEPMVCVGCKGRTGRMEHGEATSYALCADCAIQARDEMITHLRAEDGSGTDPSSDEGAMVAEALDRWRSTVCLALGLPEMGSLEQAENALAVLKTSAAVDVVGMQHRLDAAIGRERQALARAEAAEREAAQLRIRADQVPVLEADLRRAHERVEALTVEAERLRTMGREESCRLIAAESEVKRLTADLKCALVRLEEYGRAAGDVRAQADAAPGAEVPAGWPEGWTLDAMSRLPCWRAPRNSDGHSGPSAVVYEVAGGGYEAAMETPYQDTVESALELLRRMAWGLAGRPLPAPVESLPTTSLPELLLSRREPYWLATVRGRLGAEPDEDVAWDVGPGVQAADVRRERERLGIPEYVVPAPAPDPMAIYKPWRGAADELAAQLGSLNEDELEQVRVAFNVTRGARLIERLTNRIRRGA